MFITEYSIIKPKDPTSDVNMPCNIADLIEPGKLDVLSMALLQQQQFNEIKTCFPDTVKCTSCNQILLREHYAEHLTNCINTNELYETRLDNDTQKVKEKVLIKLEPVEIDLTDDINNCKSFVGGCILGAGANVNNQCLCARISAALPADNYDMNNLSDDICDSSSNSENKLLCNGTKTVATNLSDKNDACEGECACSFKPQMNNNSNRNKTDKLKDTPKIEHRSDGTIRITETFDVDIDICTEPIDLVPYNSCKDVLGNCLVSGSGTISDGCLCARMAIDDQQMSAQEIDELTPCPNTE